MLVAVDQESTTAEGGTVVGEFLDNGPQGQVQSDGFEGFVKGKAIGVIFTVFGAGKALGQVVVGRGDIAVDGGSGGGQFAVAEQIRDV